MTSTWVAEKLDIIEDLVSVLTKCCIDFVLDACRFQQREGAFSDSIIMAVTSATHTELVIVVADELAPVGTGTLHALKSGSGAPPVAAPSDC
jgi:hypothetical protein